MIAGLGNPGREYDMTRHNAGFMLLDIIAGHFNADLGGDKKCLQAKIVHDDFTLFLARPQEYMNLSGRCVAREMKSGGIHIQDILVLHDEIDIPFGDVRLKEGGGHAGHNGLRDIIDKTGSRDFHRLRIGVGRPENPHISVADYVLGRFFAEEQDKLPAMFDQALNKTLDWLKRKTNLNNL